MRDLGINPDVAESRLLDLFNDICDDPKEAAACMAIMRAAGEELRRTGLSAPDSDPPRTRKARPS
jgi:hypothetical protein